MAGLQRVSQKIFLKKKSHVNATNIHSHIIHFQEGCAENIVKENDHGTIVKLGDIKTFRLN